MSIHIGAKQGQIAQTILLPGDPLRARHFAETLLEDAECFNEVRGMLGFTVGDEPFNSALTARMLAWTISLVLLALGFEAGKVGPATATLVDPLLGRRDRAGVHPRHEAEREEVLRALGITLLDIEMRGRVERELGHRHTVDDIVDGNGLFALVLLAGGDRKDPPSKRKRLVMVMLTFRCALQI